MHLGVRDFSRCNQSLLLVRGLTLKRSSFATTLLLGTGCWPRPQVATKFLSRTRRARAAHASSRQRRLLNQLGLALLHLIHNTGHAISTTYSNGHNATAIFEKPGYHTWDHIASNNAVTHIVAIILNVQHEPLDDNVSGGRHCIGDWFLDRRMTQPKPPTAIGAVSVVGIHSMICAALTTFYVIMILAATHLPPAQPKTFLLDRKALADHPNWPQDALDADVLESERCVHHALKSQAWPPGPSASVDPHGRQVRSYFFHYWYNRSMGTPATRRVAVAPRTMWISKIRDFHLDFSVTRESNTQNNNLKFIFI